MARRRGSGGSQMIKSWQRASVDAVAVTTTQGIVSAFVQSEGAFDITLFRTRGDLLITCAPNAATDNEVIGLGVCIVSSTAATVGGASVPGPIVDAGADFWLWHKFVGFDANGATAEAGDSLTANARVEIDSEAMRKLVADQTVVLVAEALTGEMGGVLLNGGISFLFGSR